MKTFIRVVELWVPDRTRTRLEFGGSLCSEEFSEFTAVSENALFAYDEGLPGKAWAAGHPVILTKFANSYFKRTDEAIEAGLTCGVALPVFAGEFLMAVWCCSVATMKSTSAPSSSGIMTRKFPTRWDSSTAITAPPTCSSSIPNTPNPAGIWSARPDLEGRYALDHQGPAQCQGVFALGGSLRNRHQFGVGIPCTTSPDQIWVTTFLSAQATADRQAFQILMYRTQRNRH